MSYMPNKGYLGMWTHGYKRSYDLCNEANMALFFEALLPLVIGTFPSSYFSKHYDRYLNRCLPFSALYESEGTSTQSNWTSTQDQEKGYVH